MLQEDNIRKGFFEHEEFVLIQAALLKDLRPIVTLACLTGWRKEGVLSLTGPQVDLGAGTVRIDPGITKRGEGRQIFLDGKLRNVIKTP